MSSTNQRMITGFLVMLLLWPGWLSARGGFVLFHTSDMHGRISSQVDVLSAEDPRPRVGGFAAMKTFLDGERLQALKNGDLPILLDGGDFFQGTPVVEETQGECMIDLMGRVGYLGVCLGNHDLDYRLPRLREMVKKSNFLWITANVFDQATGERLPFLRSTAKVPFRGKTLGLIGILTPDTPKISFEAAVHGLEFRDPVPIVREEARRLRAQGADAVVLLSHMGIEQDRVLAKEWPEVDVILGAHSHTTVAVPDQPVPGGPLLMYSGYDGKAISRVVVTPVEGGKPQVEFAPVPLDLRRYPEDPEMKTAVERYYGGVMKRLGKIIGRSEVDLYRGVVGGDSTEGSFVADAMREEAGSDFAFINAGGLRVPIVKGDVSLEDIYYLQPFDNRLEVLTMTGAQIRDLLEKTLSVPFSPVTAEDDEYARVNFRSTAKGLKREFQGDYGYIFPANLTVTFDPEKPAGQRVLELVDGSGAPLGVDRSYTVAFSDYVAHGGDGFAFLKDIKARQAMTTMVRDAVTRKIERDGGIHQLPEPRMINRKLEVTPLK